MLTEINHRDIQAIFRIVEECTELYAQPAAWQQHLLAEVGQLLRLPVGMIAELHDFEPGKRTQLIWATENGWEDDAQRAAFFSPQSMVQGPFSISPLDVCFREALPSQAQATQARYQVMDRPTWQRTAAFNEFHAPARMDEVIYNAVRLGASDQFSVLCFGGRGSTPGPREIEIIQLVHALIAERLSTRLLTPSQPSLDDLPRRLREVYQLLLDGASEKTIATALGLSATTVNEHVQRLYRQLGVQSRAQLMTTAIRRQSPFSSR
jgi:DNA-binding CsgD family transcriptional regulator